MRFTVYRIPQLAFSAKLLCLLMVVISGAVPSMVRSVRLHNDCSSSELQVNMQGKVYSSDDPNEGFSNLTLQSVSFKTLMIFAERSRRFLCFTRGWKLVGSKKFRGKRCEFEETMLENGFNRYRSVANSNYSIGFNPKGMPLRGPRTVGTGPGRGLERCTYFLKCGVNLSQTIIDHNRGDHPGPNMRLEPFPFAKPPPSRPRYLGPSYAAPATNTGGRNAVLSFVSTSDNNEVKQKKRKKVPSERILDIATAPTLPKHHQRHKNNKRLRYTIKPLE